MSDGLVAGLRDAVAVAVLGLPLVAVLVSFGEEACHDGGEAIELLRRKLNQRNVYAMNPAIDL